MPVFLFIYANIHTLSFYLTSFTFERLIFKIYFKTINALAIRITIA